MCACLIHRHFSLLIETPPPTAFRLQPVAPRRPRSIWPLQFSIRNFQSPAMRLPFVYINVAMTADGKLAPANRVFKPFSSKADQELLMELRTSADAVMAGARTVDLYPVNLGPGGKQRREKRRKLGLTEYNLRVVVSGHGTLDPKAEIFKHRFSPIIVLTTERTPKRSLYWLQKVADVKVFGREEIDF